MNAKMCYWSIGLITWLKERNKQINMEGGEALKRYKNIPSHNFEFGNDFLDMMPKVQAQEKKLTNWTLWNF